MRRLLLPLFWVLLFGVSSGCVSSTEARVPPNSAVMVDAGSWYVRNPWPHDGNPIESVNFVVYSDSASVEARREVAAVAEEAWAELIDVLAIEPGMLRYPEGHDKIDIYAYHDHDPQDWGGRAYYGGILVWSPDHENRQTGSNRLAAVVKHELVHVIQWLITGGEGKAVDTWFIEGLPLALAGDTTAIRGLDQLERLTAEYGTVSPISVKTYSQIMSPHVGEYYYYPMFQAAVLYLMDADGQGKSPADMTAVLVDVAEGASFEASFEARMGLRVDDFDDGFFSLMASHLPKYRNLLFAPVPFALLSALVVTVVIGAIALGHRRWRLAYRSASIEKPTPSRVARIGFYGELTVATAVAIVFLLGMLYALGTEDALYNVGFTSVRLVAYSILLSYLLGSTGLLLWSVHRWTLYSRAAFLVAPLVVLATGATVFAFIIGTRII